jgi:hypothetical protein
MRSKSVPWRTLAFLAALVTAIASEASAASIVLNWADASTNEAGFKIERMPAGGTYSLLATVGSGVQAYTDSSAREGTSYCYRVSAYNNYGTSAPSNSACAQVSTSSSGTTSGTSSGNTTDGSGGSTGGSSTTSATPIPTISHVGSKWKNYKISLTMRPQNSGDTGIMFRYQDMDNYYRLVWDADSRAFRLELRSKGVLKVLASQRSNVKGEIFYPVSLSANGSQIVVSFNGKQIFSIADSTIGAGSIALYSSLSANSAFDDLVVTDLPSGVILLGDDFNNGEISGWTIIDEANNGPSAWSLSSGDLVQRSVIGSSTDGGFGTFALYTRGHWTDYRLTLSMKSMDNDTIGIMFRYHDDLNYYRFSWNVDEGFRRLQKRIKGTFTTLAADTVPYVAGRDYQLSIIAQGATLKVLVDGQTVFSVSDSALEGGTVALYAESNWGAMFDNVMVEDLRTSNILLWDDFNDGDAVGWTVIDDQGTAKGPSNWSVVDRVLRQTSPIKSNDAAKLGTFAVY